MRVRWGDNGGWFFFIGMYSEKSLKNLLFKNQYARKAVTCFEASSGRLEWSLFKSWSPLLGWGYNAGSGSEIVI